ncbi:TPA: hypothetical protein ACIBRT_003778 [Salmonella enterica subsp. enterica serovar Aberdeen]
MGLFSNGGVSQVEYDSLKNDLSIMRFEKDHVTFKAACAMMFADMQHRTGKCCGMIDAVSALIDAGMPATAKTLYETIERDLVATLNSSNQCHRNIVQAVDSLGNAKQAYLNILARDESPLYEQVNECNNLNIQIINMIKSFDQMFGVERD